MAVISSVTTQPVIRSVGMATRSRSTVVGGRGSDGGGMVASNGPTCSANPGSASRTGRVTQAIVGVAEAGSARLTR